MNFEDLTETVVMELLIVVIIYR